MCKPLITIVFFLMTCAAAVAQKWQPGHFTDVKGNIGLGLIRVNPSGRPPVKDEGFIEFKENNKATPFKLSASDVRYVVAGRDSFIVAHAPKNEIWGNRELDFAKVVLDEDTKLYAIRIGTGGRGFGFAPEVGIGAGIGTGGYGSGFGLGGGISIPIGGGRGGERLVYYYGANTAEMRQLTNENFQDIMTDVMGDEPDVVNKIQERAYGLGNIDRLIAYFKSVVASHPQN